MAQYEWMTGSKDYDLGGLQKMKDALNAGKRIRVGIDCIGHGCNNDNQELFKKALLEEYGDRLEVVCNEGACSYSYTYKLKK